MDTIGVAIDLDGTIAGRNIRKFVDACSGKFNLPLLQEENISYVSLMQHPAMVAHKQASPEKFDATIAQIEQTPLMMLAAPPLPCAVAGVQKLAQIADDITYLTVRKAHPPYVSSDVENATRSWLSEHQFPAPEQAVFCMSLMNKWLQVYQRLQVNPRRFLLIDDLAPQLLLCFSQLQSGNHPRLSEQQCRQVTDVLLDHVTLVGFGPTAFFETTSDLSLYRLKSWNDVAELINDCC